MAAAVPGQLVAQSTSPVLFVEGVHLFSAERLKKPAFCSQCDALIWGTEMGFGDPRIPRPQPNCSRPRHIGKGCTALVHRKCRSDIGRTCPLPEGHTALALSTSQPSSKRVTEIEPRHDFAPARFSTPTWCGFCGRFVKEILGKQGYKCGNCDLHIHKKCLEEALAQTCLDAVEDPRVPSTSPFASAAEALHLDFGEIIVLEELYAVLKGQEVTLRDGNSQEDCFTGVEVTDQVVAQNAWKRPQAISFLRRLYTRSILEPVLHDSLVFVDTPALYRFSTTTVVEMKKALSEKIEIVAETERRNLLAHCLREIDLLATKAIALADSIAHGLTLNSEVSTLATLLHTTFSTSAVPAILADQMTQHSAVTGLRRTKGARKRLESDTSGLREATPRSPRDFATSVPPQDKDAVPRALSWKDRILAQIQSEQDKEDTSATLPTKVVKTNSVKAFSSQHASLPTYMESSDDDTDELSSDEAHESGETDDTSSDDSNDTNKSHGRGHHADRSHQRKASHSKEVVPHDSSNKEVLPTESRLVRSKVTPRSDSEREKDTRLSNSHGHKDKEKDHKDKDHKDKDSSDDGKDKDKDTGKESSLRLKRGSAYASGRVESPKSTHKEQGSKDKDSPRTTTPGREHKDKDKDSPRKEKEKDKDLSTPRVAALTATPRHGDPKDADRKSTSTSESSREDQERSGDHKDHIDHDKDTGKDKDKDKEHEGKGGKAPPRPLRLPTAADPTNVASAVPLSPSPKSPTKLRLTSRLGQRDLSKASKLVKARTKRRDPAEGVAHKELREVIQDLRLVSVAARRHGIQAREITAIRDTIKQLDSILSKETDLFQTRGDAQATVYSGTIDTSPEQWPLFFDFNELWFEKYFKDEEYGAYFARYGLGTPFIAVLKLEVVEYGLSTMMALRGIIATKKGIKRVLFLEDELPDKSLLTKWTHFAQYITSLMLGESAITEFSLVVKPEFPELFHKFERVDPIISKSVGVGLLYCKPGQDNEDDWFSNTKGSAAYDGFMRCVGSLVDLKNWNTFPPYRFAGGLDTSGDQNGKKSLYSTYNEVEIMFHVSTLMPPSNDGSLSKKRFLGNDVVLVVYQEIGCKPFDIKAVPSHFIHVIVLVTEIPDAEDGTHRFRISVCKLQSDIPHFGPPVPFPPVFKIGPDLKEFFLQTVINAHLASCRGEAVLKKFHQVYTSHFENLTTSFVKGDLKIDEEVKVRRNSDATHTRPIGLSSAAAMRGIRVSVEGSAKK